MVTSRKVGGGGGGVDMLNVPQTAGLLCRIILSGSQQDQSIGESQRQTTTSSGNRFRRILFSSATLPNDNAHVWFVMADGG